MHTHLVVSITHPDKPHKELQEDVAAALNNFNWGKVVGEIQDQLPEGYEVEVNGWKWD